MDINTDIATWLQAQGFQVDQPLLANDKGQQPTILAAQQGNVEVLGYLLQLGADLNQVDLYGNNALWAACFAGSSECIAMLLAAGINIDYQNLTGVTALIYSSSSGKDEVVKQLLQAGANPLLVSQDEFSALDLAATLPCLKLLRSAVKALE